MYNSDFTIGTPPGWGPHRDVVGEIAPQPAPGPRFGVSSHRADTGGGMPGRTFDSDVNDPSETTGLYGRSQNAALGAVNDTREPDRPPGAMASRRTRQFRERLLARTTEIIDKYTPRLRVPGLVDRPAGLRSRPKAIRRLLLRPAMRNSTQAKEAVLATRSRPCRPIPQRWISSVKDGHPATASLAD